MHPDEYRLELGGQGDGGLGVRLVPETTFGNPGPRLVRGEGDGNDVDKFKLDHVGVWADWRVAVGHPLTDETVLIVEEFELIAEAE